MSMIVNMFTSSDAPPRLLVVDNDEFGAQVLQSDLSAIGCEVEVCTPGDRLARLLARGGWDAILADQDSASIETFEKVLSHPEPPVLMMMSGFGSIDDAVEAVRAGAADFLTKPLSADQLRVSLGRALEQRELRNENKRLKEEVGERFQLDKLVSRSPEMHAVFDTIRKVADTRATILIEGESGTGKTLLARGVHRSSSRSMEAFIAVNCGALPDNLLESELFGHERGAFTGAVKTRPGKFEAADRGTIFLDEIACASIDLQIKLLRVLQEREFERVGSTETRKVDVRVIAASNRSLAEEVQAGRFREDLYYRLNVLGLKIPPLRERCGDVKLLAETFLERISREYGREIEGFTPGALAALLAHSWPGNVRELENSVERAVLLTHGEHVGIESLPEALGQHAQRDSAKLTDPTACHAGLPSLAGRHLKDALEDAERSYILQALQENNGSRKASALQLGINRTTLFNKMTKLGLMDQRFDDTTDAHPNGPGASVS